MGNRADFVTISYGVPGDFNMTLMELMVLVVDQATVIRDRCGRNLSIRDLRVGMRVDAEFSQRMTFSLPPQAQAYQIIVNC